MLSAELPPAPKTITLAPSPSGPQTPGQGRRVVLAARQTGHRFTGDVSKIGQNPAKS